mmetsp:Transcript_84567/g.196645  ORF Transcript_84567/g.196645 Transcript_84567/m.196645 type:complete len:85 (-) Transcript_84567:224-478(-)
MQFMSGRATKVALFYVVQVMTVLGALSLSLLAFASMAPIGLGQFKEEQFCAPLRMVGWFVLPLAFLSGGLVNAPGFASAAALLV